MEFRYLHSISEISAQQWDSLVHSDYPFTRHAFLAALELSGSVAVATGWQPHHLCVYQAEQLVAVMPLYIKQHSYGEYIFDWSWAEAYQRHGYNYYPKLLAAIPFTPATGPRLCIHPDSDAAALYEAVGQQLIAQAQQLQASSVHVLYHSQANHFNAPFMARSSVQFHWFNQGYTCFDDFLAQFKSRKRKTLNKERRSVKQQGISLQRLSGNEISEEIWQQFYYFYQLTYAKRSGHGGYLKQDFFKRIASSMADQIMLVIARKDQDIVAGALNFFDSHSLYGRYWGCSEELEQLHFEACYYQGIEFCIERGLQRFDSGAQGEHKIQRGFQPVDTHSSHWLAQPDFAHAIQQFLQQETTELKRYKLQCSKHLPFKAT
ncbi:GNAT family N-acetyltransferase [Dasania sp. GY-MA-18]|uniref:GNAT family N-acetyltransferase n=1 Tax=Dasania phycosphaerae TaxID=2950436 RepID=A0A9J6RJA0_9GAMM|nr:MULTISPECIES: GNAT family N-acetyltransferase [Dasania]MCR8922021.1 GNAT family N-acetyltransferase [Dasania sp. GY-MA-18]MCZ0864449.1 GNAT family N-acetyltransferase [Dasania phycosphaerae]MCZ0868177.1 GNAT family N-acetyltransferase [Dasania phycosphaerae]